MASALSLTQQVSPELYTGQKTTDSGQILYFGMELLDEVNYVFWNYYAEKAYYLASFCGSLCRTANATEYPQYPNEKATAMCYTEAEYHKVMQFIQKKRYFESLVFRGTRGGISGMNQVLTPSKERVFKYIAYLSKKPVTESHILKEYTPCKNQAEYNALFGMWRKEPGSQKSQKKEQISLFTLIPFQMNGLNILKCKDRFLTTLEEQSERFSLWLS